MKAEAGRRSDTGSTGNGPPAATFPIRLPRAFIEEAWRYLTPREKAIWPVLVAHLPNVCPGRERIGRMAGLGRSAITKGLGELEAVGLIASRHQRRTASGFSTNQYVLADLRDPATLRRVLNNLRSRSVCDRERGAAYAVTGRPRTRSQSLIKRSQIKRTTTRAAGDAEGVVVLSDDDQKKMAMLATVKGLRLGDGLLPYVRRAELDYVRRLVPYGVGQDGSRSVAALVVTGLKADPPWDLPNRIQPLRTAAERRGQKTRADQVRRLQRLEAALSYASAEQRAGIENAYPNREDLCRAVGDVVLLHGSPREALNAMLQKV